MPSTTVPTRALLLPGSGSDEVFLDRAFVAALTGVGVVAVTVRPDPTQVVTSYLLALDAAAAQDGPLLVGGVSLGAAVAAGWALQHRERVSGVLLALPAWWGAPLGAPAAALAAHSAGELRAGGLDAVLGEVDTSSPPWLAAELRRAWTLQWPHLPGALEEAARYVAPTVAALTALTAPVGVVAAVDDPVHPVAAAEALAGGERVRIERVRLAELGVDPGVLGRAAVRALCAARGSG